MKSHLEAILRLFKATINYIKEINNQRRSEVYTHYRFSHIPKLVFPGDHFLIRLKNATKSLKVLKQIAKNVQIW